MTYISHLRKKAVAVGAAVALVLSSVVPMLMGTAKADQLTNRSLTLESAQAGPGADGQNIFHEFSFNVAQATSIGSMEFQYCTTPLGTCTAPTGMNLSSYGVALGTTSSDQTINSVLPTNTYALGTGGNAPTANDVKIEASSANTISAGQTVMIHFTGIENPTTSTPTSNTFFVRITTYSDTAYTTTIDTGVVAAAVVPLLTVSARVQEVLHFCIDNATTAGGMLDTTALGTDCSNFVNSYAVAGNTVDIGIVDSTTNAQSPVAAVNGGNAADGMMMVRSNALNGVSIGYRAVQQSGTNHQGALRVVGSTCNAGVVQSDRCFDSASTKTALVAGTEQFGMTGRYINTTSSTVPTSNLSLTTDYDSTSTTGYAWQEDGTFAEVATSVPSSGKVVDDEAVVLGFGAVAALTTPPGQYTAQADFIAVATY